MEPNAVSHEDREPLVESASDDAVTRALAQGAAFGQPLAEPAPDESVVKALAQGPNRAGPSGDRT